MGTGLELRLPCKRKAKEHGGAHIDQPERQIGAEGLQRDGKACAALPGISAYEIPAMLRALCVSRPRVCRVPVL